MFFQHIFRSMLTPTTTNGRRHRSLSAYFAPNQVALRRPTYTIFLLVTSALLLIGSVSVFGVAMADVPYLWQKHFQDGATVAVFNTYEFYDDLSALLLFIAFFVSWLVIRLNWYFSSGHNTGAPFLAFRHHTQLEIWWTLIPTAILLWIATPSISLLYSTEDVEVPDLSFRAIGRQWFWTYELGASRNPITLPVPQRPVHQMHWLDMDPFQQLALYRWERDNGLTYLDYAADSTGAFSPALFCEKAHYKHYSAFDYVMSFPARGDDKFDWTLFDWMEYATGTYERYLATVAFFEQHNNAPSRELLWEDFLPNLGCEDHFPTWNPYMMVVTRHGGRWDDVFLLAEILGDRLFTEHVLPVCPYSAPAPEVIPGRPPLAWDSTIGPKPSLTTGLGFAYDFPYLAERGRSSRWGQISFFKNEVFKPVPYQTRSLSEWWGLPELMKSRNWLLETQAPIVLPSIQQLRLLTTATDVIHSWAVPAFGVKIDACPGRLNQVLFSVLRNGMFYGQCSEICGINHAFMPIQVRVVDEHVFEAFRTAPYQTRRAFDATEKLRLEATRVFQNRMDFARVGSWYSGTRAGLSQWPYPLLPTKVRR